MIRKVLPKTIHREDEDLEARRVKYERAKIAERTRRGKLRKAREGKIVTPTPKYGFRLNETGDALVICKPEMAVVEKIFRMAADGYGVGKVQSALYAEGIPSPRGGWVWDRRVLRRIVASDDYRPLAFEEIAEMVTPEVAAQLDSSKEYGVQWYNRNKVISDACRVVCPGEELQLMNVSPKPEPAWVHLRFQGDSL